MGQSAKAAFFVQLNITTNLKGVGDLLSASK